MRGRRSRFAPTSFVISALLLLTTKVAEIHG